VKQSAIALLSGGLDSSVAVTVAAKEYDLVKTLTFDYGQRAVEQEIKAAKDLCVTLGITHEVIKLTWLAGITNTSLVNNAISLPQTNETDLNDMARAVERARSVWVPNRNGLMCNIAACYADAMGAKAVVVGFNAEEGATFSDNTSSFVKALNCSFEYSTLVHPLVVSPTLDLEKKEIAAKAVQLGIRSFWCCYEGGSLMCGKCESCVRTIRAFNTAGYADHLKGLFEDAII